MLPTLRLAALFCTLPTLNALADQSLPAKHPKVLIIGIDGLRADALFAADAPHIKSLIAGGCWTDTASASEFTVSGPGWSSFLCGVWPDKHGVRDNKFRGAMLDKHLHLFELIKQKRSGIRTAHFVTWLEIDKFILGNFTPDFRAAVNNEENDGDNVVTPLCAQTLQHRDVDICFFYLGDVDTAGHAHGFSPFVPAYLAEIADSDRKVGEILTGIRARPTYPEEDWLILLSSDHAGSLDKSHGRNETAHREILFIVSGDAAHTARGRISSTINQVDIVPTAMAHLGVTPDPAWELDGRVVGQPVMTMLDTNLLYNGDAEASTGHADQKANSGVAGWRDWSAMTVIPYGAGNDLPDNHAPLATDPAANEPPRADGGRNFFCGGNAQRSEISQTIDISDLATATDADTLTITLSGSFGGFAEQTDMAWLTATCLDEHDGILTNTRAGPVTLDDRRKAFAINAAASARAAGSGSAKPVPLPADPTPPTAPDTKPQPPPSPPPNTALTGFLYRATTINVPPNTRRILVTLTAEAGEGLNDGYADDLSLVVSKR